MNGFNLGARPPALGRRAVCKSRPAAMDPDNPALARAQAALKQQLTAARTRAEDELRAQRKQLQVTRERREGLGVELFGFQQQLAKLQVELDRQHDERNRAAAEREGGAGTVAERREQAASEAQLAAADRARVEALQSDVDRRASRPRRRRRSRPRRRAPPSLTSDQRAIPASVLSWGSGRVRSRHGALAGTWPRCSTSRRTTRR